MRFGWFVHPRNLVVYAILICAAVLVFRFGITPWHVGIALVPLLALYYFVLPHLAVRRLPAFDMQLRRMLVAGDPDRLLAFYKSQLLLRAFAPPGLMKHRLGQIHAARRVWPLAFQAYFEALRSGHVKDRFGVLQGFVEAGFHAGEDESIRSSFPELIKDPRSMAATEFMYLHVMISGDTKPAVIDKLLEEWEGRVSSEADRALASLARAELLALGRKRKQALARLEQIDVDRLPATIRPLALLLEAKILHVDGRKKEARRLFKKVEKDPDAGRALVELRDFLEN